MRCMKMEPSSQDCLEYMKVTSSVHCKSVLFHYHGLMIIRYFTCCYVFVVMGKFWTINLYLFLSFGKIVTHVNIWIGYYFYSKIKLNFTIDLLLLEMDLWACYSFLMCCLSLFKEGLNIYITFINYMIGTKFNKLKYIIVKIRML